MVPLGWVALFNPFGEVQMSQPHSPEKRDAAQTGKRRVYLYGSDRERDRPVAAAFSGGGCGGVVC
jgi:hypothetical protein